MTQSVANEGIIHKVVNIGTKPVLNLMNGENYGFFPKLRDMAERVEKAVDRVERATTKEQFKSAEEHLYASIVLEAKISDGKQEKQVGYFATRPAKDLTEFKQWMVKAGMATGNFKANMFSWRDLAQKAEELKKKFNTLRQRAEKAIIAGKSKFK